MNETPVGVVPAGVLAWGGSRADILLHAVTQFAPASLRHCACSAWRLRRCACSAWRLHACGVLPSQRKGIQKNIRPGAPQESPALSPNENAPTGRLVYKNFTCVFGDSSVK